MILQTGTATFSQTCDSYPRNPDSSIDGKLDDYNGWAIATSCSPGDTTSNQTAVWETNTDVNASRLDFLLYQNYSGHLLGRFRLSVTSDDPSTFADGRETDGNVTANWTVLTDPLVTGLSGMTFKTLGDSSILAGGAVPEKGSYEIQYTDNFIGITGIRLEALEDPTLPHGGPGLQTINGNFVLSEIEVFASGTPFIAFAPTLKTTLGPATDDDVFELRAIFTLGTFSEGINPPTEDVTIRVGSFSRTFPVGSFKLVKGKFTFSGVIDGVGLKATITRLGGSNFAFDLGGEGADLGGTVMPVPVLLMVGDDSGSATLTNITAK